MDATITNIGTEIIFIPGPNLSIAAGASAAWNDIGLPALDANVVLRQAILVGDVTVTLTYDPTDAVNYTAVAHADLPATGADGQILYVTDGRKTGELAAAGTGVLAYWSDSAWRVFYDDTAVAV